MAERTGSIVDKLQAHLFCPCCNGIIVPLVRRQEVKRSFFVYPQLGVILFKVCGKLLLCYQQAVAFCPVAVQQMFIAVRTNVVARLFYFLNDGSKLAGEPAG